MTLELEAKFLRDRASVVEMNVLRIIPNARDEFGEPAHVMILLVISNRK